MSVALLEVFLSIFFYRTLTGKHFIHAYDVSIISGGKYGIGIDQL